MSQPSIELIKAAEAVLLKVFTSEYHDVPAHVVEAALAIVTHWRPVEPEVITKDNA